MKRQGWECIGCNDEKIQNENVSTLTEALGSGLDFSQPKLIKEKQLMVCPVGTPEQGLMGASVLAGNQVESVKPDHFSSLSKMATGVVKSFMK